MTAKLLLCLAVLALALPAGVRTTCLTFDLRRCCPLKHCPLLALCELLLPGVPREHLDPIPWQLAEVCSADLASGAALGHNVDGGRGEGNPDDKAAAHSPGAPCA